MNKLKGKENILERIRDNFKTKTNVSLLKGFYCVLKIMNEKSSVSECFLMKFQNIKNKGKMIDISKGKAIHL